MRTALVLDKVAMRGPFNSLMSSRAQRTPEGL